MIRTAADRAAAVDALQTIAANWRARTMPDHEQRRFDALAHDIEAFDTAQRVRVAVPPDARDGILAQMRARARGQIGW